MHSENIIAISTDKRHIHMEGKSYRTNLKLTEHCFNKYVYSSYLTCTRVAPNIPYMPSFSKPNALYYIILF